MCASLIVFLELTQITQLWLVRVTLFGLLFDFSDYSRVTAVDYPGRITLADYSGGLLLKLLRWITPADYSGRITLTELL